MCSLGKLLVVWHLTRMHLSQNAMRMLLCSCHARLVESASQEIQGAISSKMFHVIVVPLQHCRMKALTGSVQPSLKTIRYNMYHLQAQWSFDATPSLVTLTLDWRSWFVPLAFGHVARSTIGTYNIAAICSLSMYSQACIQALLQYAA